MLSIFTRYLLRAFSLIVLCTILSACEKEIDFDYKDIEPLTVIEGIMTPDGIQVSITMTTPMDEPLDTVRLTDATVIVEDMETSEVIGLSPDTSGMFVSDYKGVVGHRYRLEVSSAGEVYSSECVMTGPAQIVGLGFSWVRMPYDYVAALQGLYLDDPSVHGQCYWVKVYRNGKIYSWSEQSDRTAENGLMTYLSLTSRRDTDEEDDGDVLFDGDVVTVTVWEISVEMRGYLEAIANDSNGPAMFSGKRCLGYFMAGSPVTESIEYHPDELELWEGK